MVYYSSDPIQLRRLARISTWKTVKCIWRDSNYEISHTTCFETISSKTVPLESWYQVILHKYSFYHVSQCNFPNHVLLICRTNWVLMIPEHRVVSGLACLFLVSPKPVKLLLVEQWIIVKSQIYDLKNVILCISVGNTREHWVCGKHVNYGSLLPQGIVVRRFNISKHSHQLPRFYFPAHHLGRIHLRCLPEQTLHMSDFRFSWNNSKEKEKSTFVLLLQMLKRILSTRAVLFMDWSWFLITGIADSYDSSKFQGVATWLLQWVKLYQGWRSHHVLHFFVYLSFRMRRS